MTTESKWAPTLRKRMTEFFFPDGELDRDFRQTYFALRNTLAGVGLLLPIVLVFVGGLALGVPWPRMTALSDFYWLPTTCQDTPLRAWFVGSLCAAGISLIAYKGYGWLENWLLNLAGSALIIVALRPESWRPIAYVGKLHYPAALVFFGLVTLTILFCAGKTLHDRVDQGRRDRWRRLYKILAVAMLATVVAFPVGEWLHFAYTPIVVEWLGIWIFAAYWGVKTYELSRVSQLEPRRPLREMIDGLLAPRRFLRTSASPDASLRYGPGPKLAWRDGELVLVERAGLVGEVR